MYIDSNGFEIEDKVRDRITGFEGTIVGIVQWTTGCARASIQPPMTDKFREEGKGVPQAYDFDCLNLEMITEGPRHAKAADPVATGARKGGPAAPSRAR